MNKQSRQTPNISWTKSKSVYEDNIDVYEGYVNSAKLFVIFADASEWPKAELAVYPYLNDVTAHSFSYVNTKCAKEGAKRYLKRWQAALR